MGAKVKGAGTDEIEIEGVKKLKEISYNIMPDRIETGTFLCLAAITRGEIKLEKTNPSHLTPVINKLEEAGCEIRIKKDTITIRKFQKIKSNRYKNNAIPRVSNRYAINYGFNIYNSQRNHNNSRKHI